VASTRTARITQDADHDPCVPDRPSPALPDQPTDPTTIGERSADDEPAIQHSSASDEPAIPHRAADDEPATRHSSASNEPDAARGGGAADDEPAIDTEEPMTDTIISSATAEVVIGFDRPFVMIGERINPTGRKLLAAEMKEGDFSRVSADAVAQVAAGAHMLDVNAGIPLADEPALLAQAIQLVQSVTDVPLSIDSSIIEALEAGIEVYEGKPLINSVTGEDEVMERVLPLVARHGAAVVAISNDETGISEDPDVRFEVAKKIVQRAADHGIPRADVVVDPLVMPIGAMGQAGQQVFRLVRRLRDELGVNTTCGASNVSFGLPNRHAITGTFLSMAVAAGMTSAIMNPLHAEVKNAVMAADVLAGHDQDCANWIAVNREGGDSTPRSDGRSRRRGGRRARIEGGGP
jgi:5-methyltetrahydrofolate--homocysteine methyltransferase